MCKELSRGHWICLCDISSFHSETEKRVFVQKCSMHINGKAVVGEKRPFPKCCLRSKPLHQTYDNEHMCVGRLKRKKMERGSEKEGVGRGSIMKKNGRLQIKCANICLVVPFSDFQCSPFYLSVLQFLFLSNLSQLSAFLIPFA